jgi:hypothetical protein
MEDSLRQGNPEDFLQLISVALGDDENGLDIRRVKSSTWTAGWLQVWASSASA